MTDSLPVFVCGGIGATPDDLTRDCAAQAAGIKLERHQEAAALIEAKFGDAAYPARITMADLPSGCQLIPNPYNQIPGFHLNRHYFLPGFPEMAWPMAEWVLDQFYYQPPAHIKEQSVQVVNTPESALIPIMEELSDRFSSLKMFSLPRIGNPPSVELGFRGCGDISTATQLMKEMLRANDIPFND
jgi:molybdopterin-biosynthesis enzyme MoeA-like protein